MKPELIINAIYDECAKRGFGGVARSLRAVLGDERNTAELAGIIVAAVLAAQEKAR